MRIVHAVVVIAVTVISTCAQELGRGELNAEHAPLGLGRAELPTGEYSGFLGGGDWGVKVGLGWAFVDWDLGPTDGSDSLFAPQVSLFYKTTDSLDVNFSLFSVAAEDDDLQLGSTEADMTRLALGLRYWLNTRTRITPYFGFGLGYYILDGATENMYQDGLVVPATVAVKEAPGAFFEGGVAFQISDRFFINVDLAYDFLLETADAEINEQDEDFDIRSLSVNLGATWVF
jgi:outer membrane protein W